METRFLESWINRTHSVWGFELEPFSLLHSVKLEAIESPLELGGPVSAIDLFHAALICSGQEIREPAKAEWDFVFDDEREKWGAYVRDYDAPPEFWERGGVGSSYNAPWQLVIVTKLIRLSSIGWDEAWTMGRGKAIWAMASINEQETGDSGILPEGLIEDLEASKANG